MNTRKNSKGNAYKNRNKRNKNLKNNTDGALAQPFQATRLPIYRPMGLIVPDKMYSRLKYSGVQQITVAIGAAATAVRWRPSSVFDVDPLLGGTTIPGFTELAGLYGSYRTTRSNIKLEVAPQDTSRVASVVLVPLNVDPGSGPSSATQSSWTMNPYAIYEIFGTAGSPNICIKNSMSTEKIFGSKMVYFDDAFSSLVTTSPTNNWFWAVSIITGFTVATTNYITTILLDLEIDVEFFNRKSLTS